MPQGRWWSIALAVVCIVMKSELTLAETVVDDFVDIGGWHALAADGTRVELGQDDGPHGRALRIDFDFTQRGGFVLVRKDRPLPLPGNYAFRFDIRASAPQVDLE